MKNSTKELKKRYFEKSVKFTDFKEKLHRMGYDELDQSVNLDIDKRVIELYIMIIDLKIDNLYRYASFENWDRDITNLYNNTIYLTSMNCQNDPFEFSLNVKLSEDERFNELNDILINHNQQLKNQLAIKCFTEKYDNLLMWAHYANSHSGYCIEYSMLDMFNKFNELIIPVNYCSKLPICNENYDILQSIYRATTKSKDWEYEQEWRIFAYCKDESEHTVTTPKPKAIYTGCNVKQKQFDEALELCENLKISLYKMKKSETEYKLEKELIYKGEPQ